MRRLDGLRKLRDAVAMTRTPGRTDVGMVHGFTLTVRWSGTGSLGATRTAPPSTVFVILIPFVCAFLV